MFMLALNIIFQFNDLSEMLLQYIYNITSKLLVKSIIVGYQYTVMPNIPDQPICMTINLLLVPWQNN